MSLNKKEGLDERITIIKDNFENLHVEDEYFTHVYALESACHSSGAGKNMFVAEMARVLKSAAGFLLLMGF